MERVASDGALMSSRAERRLLAPLGMTLAAFCSAWGSLAVPAAAQDSTFQLATGDPARSPSAFIGNGRLGVVIPALGIGASNSFVAGLYEHAPSDVPRIAVAPAWNDIAISDGKHHLDSAAVAAGEVERYRQVLDMHSGTARTTYDWVHGSRRTAVAVESFVSRADTALAAMRITLTPDAAGPLRLRFALSGRPPPRRLALATLTRSDPAWRPYDVWYPGHMVVRTRAATPVPGGARLSLAATPVGRTTVLALAAAVGWPRDLSHPQIRARTVGDTALVEIAFDATPGRTYTFTHLVGFGRSASDASAPAAASRGAEAARARGWSALAAANALAWRRRWETDIEIHGNPDLQRVVRSMLFYLLASGGEGTGMGIPPMGLSSGGYYGHVFWDSDTWMFPSLLVTHPDVAHSLVDFRGRTLAAARANARANGYQGAMYPWEADERGQETTPTFAIQNAKMEIHVNGDVALAQWQYYLATGDSTWLAVEGLPGDPRDREFLGEPGPAGLRHAPLPHRQRGLGARRARRRERRRVHQCRRPQESGDRGGGEPPNRLGAGPALGRGRGRPPYALRLGERILPDVRGRARFHTRGGDSAAQLSPGRRR